METKNLFKINENGVPKEETQYAYFNTATKGVVQHKSPTLFKTSPELIPLTDEESAVLISAQLLGKELGLDQHQRPKVIEMPPKPKESLLVRYVKSPLQHDREQGDYRTWLKEPVPKQELIDKVSKSYEQALRNASVVFHVDNKTYHLRDYDRVRLLENVVYLQSNEGKEIDGMDKTTYEMFYSILNEKRRSLEEQKNLYIENIINDVPVEFIQWE